ncbi:MAG: hypothetical protein EYC70_07445 [Planctomycetota bacterium]|nr:MAG: hypothetical protein EYC70_07445 [Planctomycetota bacterium]
MLPNLITAAFLLAAPALQSDRIVLTNGKVMSVDRVTSETYKEVVYKTGTTEGRKPAQDVIEVQHATGAAALEDFDTALGLMNDGDWGGAIGAFNEVLADERLMGNPRYAWVVQHSLFRQAQCNNALGDAKGVSAAVDALLTKVPDSFFFAPALKLKAQAATDAQDAATARKVYEELAAAVQSKGLPERWGRESELGLILLDSGLKGNDKIRRLQQIVEKNRELYPTVANGANVAIGTTMLEMESPDFDAAEKFFKDILESGQADDLTEAAAWSGLGDVAYKRALKFDDPKQADGRFLDAALAHLRVILMHKEVVSLVPRSIFYASDALTRRQDETSKRQGYFLAQYANTKFPRSAWTERLLQALNLKPK